MWALVLGRGGFEPPKALGQLIYSQSRLTASVSARPGDFTDNRPMGKRRWILWQGLIAPSMERKATYGTGRQSSRMGSVGNPWPICAEPNCGELTQYQQGSHLCAMHFRQSKKKKWAS